MLPSIIERSVKSLAIIISVIALMCFTPFKRQDCKFQGASLASVIDTTEEMTITYHDHVPWYVLRDWGVSISDVLESNYTRKIYISDTAEIAQFRGLINKAGREPLPYDTLYLQLDVFRNDTTGILVYPRGIDVEFVVTIEDKESKDTLGIGRMPYNKIQFGKAALKSHDIYYFIIAEILSRDSTWSIQCESHDDGNFGLPSWYMNEEPVL
ncbi:MAG: hypothetical protein MJZ09_03420 [Bacteroidales bacterium]|nr:hypothetical protein [Bacteroidales bacterium]